MSAYAARLNAPIALFVFNRPEHTRRTIEALLGNPESSDSELTIFSDAPRLDKQARGVSQVREYIRSIKGFKKVDIVEREHNFGLARSIIDGVSQLCDTRGRVIVVEDDLITSPYFLKYMHDALELYADDERVASIHGYVYPIKSNLPETFFLRGADCWGWATWRRAWQLFDPDGAGLLQKLEDAALTHRFDLGGAYPFTRMLKRQIAGTNDSWAVRWHAGAFLLNKLTLYPGRTLVINIGIDGTGTHCHTGDEFVGSLSPSPVRVMRMPVAEDERVRQQIAHYLRSTRPSVPARVLRYLRKRAARIW